MRFVALFALCLFGACHKQAPSEQTPSSTYELRAVNKAELAALPKPAEPPALEPKLVERLRSQIVDRSHLLGKMRALELADIASSADAAVVAADALLSDAKSGDEEKRSAIEVLGGIDTQASAEALAKRVDIQTSHEPWIRETAAFELGRLSSDVVVPGMCAQLKYETDAQTVIWIAALLAKHRNYSGLDGLRVLGTGGRTPEIRDHALSMLSNLAREAGFDDPDALYAAWNSADTEHKVPREEPSPALRAEIWMRVADLGVFDLKHVDDARFVLSRSPWWVVDVLVAALHEEEPHLRACVAQSLERMGARASAACPELVKALEEPRTAPAVATALAAIGCRDCLPALVACTHKGRGAELRHAAARALGALGSQPAIDALRTLFESADTPDLRQTAAEALVELGQGALVAPLLVESLTRPGADHDAAETALERWLTQSADADAPGAKQALEAWRALAGDPNQTSTVAQTSARHAARATLLSERLPALLPPKK
ncbi:MAG: HEAT repeat domain-containing protein [Planctomycetes bacterium]|nr:HEAT repeat domain-containing protein [Planctomycetota bacterium]